MLNVTTLPLGSYQTNCYILHPEGSGSCVLIDPGQEPERLLAELARMQLTVDAILLTHGHFDHVGAVDAVCQATGCELFMHKADWAQQSDPTLSYFYPLANRELAPMQFCDEGDSITAGGLTFTVMATPGHTAGSVCYRCGDALFCGDTLFAGSCGRIDLPGGDRMTMLCTLERLADLKEDLRIFPGHGPASTLQQEQETNPYLQC